MKAGYRWGLFMEDKNILGVSKKAFYAVIAVCVLGNVIGSFYDYPINEVLANKTEIGKLFASYGMYLSYCLYPAAGMCLYMGLKKKGKKYEQAAAVLFVVAYFMAVYYSNNYMSKNIRASLGYVAGQSSPLLSMLAWLIWVLAYSWIPFVMKRLLDDSDPDRLIAVGAVILIAGIVSDNVNLWLKQVSSRPRYKYLLTLDNPRSEYRDWWQFVPDLAGNDDNFKSWPSGNMTIASMMFSLPMLANCLKKHSKKLNRICFIIACIYVIIYGYNRIHMTNHFLSDVCFGTLITYLIHAVTARAFHV